MFLHDILNFGEKRLVNQVFWEQVNNPVKNDWICQVQKDLKTFELDYLSLNNIKHLKKEQFRALVKMKCEKIAFKELVKEKSTKAKIKNIKYKNLHIQKYLMSSKISLKRKKLLFKIRTQMIAVQTVPH